MKKAIQFGAGNIGRGFIGELFIEAGFEVVFIDVDDTIVNLMNERGKYTVRAVSDTSEDLILTNARAIHGKEVEKIAEEIKTADIMATAVGANAIKYIAPTIAKGINARADADIKTPINIIICENLQGAEKILKGLVQDSLDSKYHEYLDNYVGFVMSVVGRMVPIMTEEQKKEDALLVIVEPYKHLPIDKNAIKGDFPDIPNIELCGNFQAFVDTKLYTHNAGHAVAAYLGYLKGYEYIYEAMADELIKITVKAALEETGKGLIAKHNLDPQKHQDHIDDLLYRFRNKALRRYSRLQ
ncbi:MAG: mannitol-1-phosphate 5-dehydrogenase, partial [Armatimonadota bacterium]